MIIKRADDKTQQITTLQNLLTHPDAKDGVKKRIEKEIRKIRAGVEGEREASYEMEFYYGASDKWMLIHDLRIKCDDERKAQIDHIIINQFLDIWVCESKSISEGIAINEHGECTTFYRGKAHGVPSPFEQIRKHIAILESVFRTGKVGLPFNINPTINGLVLVSKSARITRPTTKIDGIEGIIKNDGLKLHIDKQNTLKESNQIDIDTLKDFAHRLASIHSPIEFDWHEKFGLSEKQTDENPRYCNSCGEAVTSRVITFCSSKPKFGGKTYCITCQNKFPITETPSPSCTQV